MSEPQRDYMTARDPGDETRPSDGPGEDPASLRSLRRGIAVVGADDVRRAIAIVEDSRETHVLWAAYIRNYPDAAVRMVRRVDAAGDADHHANCIADYDHVLGVLRALLPLETATAGPRGEEPAVAGEEEGGKG